MTTHRSISRAAALVATGVSAALILTACGGNSGNSGAGSHGEGHKDSAPVKKGDHNTADVSFAKGMIPHHRQAVEMADLAASRASSPKVKSLSADIKKAQGPEIKKMSGWLKSWNEKVPANMPNMDHSGHGMPGMMKPADMAKLKKASGKEFDSMFLEMMIDHHEGAVSMAKSEKSGGSHKSAKDMAGDIVTSQTTEIQDMHKLLGR